MKKIISFILIAVILIFGCSCSGATKVAKSNQLTDSAINVLSQTNAEKPTEPSKTDSVIALLLYPHIEKAITNYFGEFTQFALYDAKVNNITQVDTDFSFKVTITVPTFHGPHNPPYGNEIMTFTVAPSGVTLDNYVHKDVAP